MSDRYEDYEEEEEEEVAAPVAVRPRPPRDWFLITLFVGTAIFLLIFGAITIMAPRRPFLGLRADPPKPAIIAPAAPAQQPTGPPPKPAAP